MISTVIFDIDGTIADLDHRLHYVANFPKNYEKFHDECDKDAPIEPVISLMIDMYASGYKVLLVSGRTDRVRDKTEAWLQRHMIPYHGLHMRKDGDWRSDVIVKSEILDELLAAGHVVRFVVDDRTSVVNMWRERGLTCLQCREWTEAPKPKKRGTLALMVGPSGAGKSEWLKSIDAADRGIRLDQVVSSDTIRAELCGDFKDQSKNAEVFAALHDIVKTRINHGLNTVVDATNIRRADRMSIIKSAKPDEIIYFVINRSVSDKRVTGGWRNELKKDLIGKHEETFQAQLKDILSGDGMENVMVVDLR